MNSILLAIKIIHSNAVADTWTKIGITFFLALISGIMTYFKSDSWVTSLITFLLVVTFQCCIFFSPIIIGIIVVGLIIISIIVVIVNTIKKIVNKIKIKNIYKKVK